MGNRKEDMNESVMWIEVNLRVSFYQPEKLERGAWFMNSLYPGTDREFVELWELEDDVPDSDYEEFVQKNGYPVEVMITMEMQNPDEPDDIIAFGEDFGWVYDTEEELMEFITIEHINNIIQNYGGKVFLLIDEIHYDDGDGEILPERESNLIILTYPFEEEVEFED
jgi:hypothetical protein